MVPPQRVIPDFQYADLLEKGPFNDFRDGLRDDGYVVVKNAIPRERALEYRQRAFGWLESFGLGFKRDDPATFPMANTPVHSKGGMISSYGIHQEQWVWDIRCEPGVKAVFEHLWGTKELVSSMDSGAIMLPGNMPGPEDKHWPHIDLSPSRKGFFCAQSIVNLNDNGPNDGGLLVMKGSSRLMKEFFDVHGRPPVHPTGKIDWHMFTEEEKEWFFARGCEWIKVCAEAGDLILWDSATIHQNTPPTGTNDRIVTYVCMGPAHLVSEEDMEVRKSVMEKKTGTSHAPFHGTFEVDRDQITIRPETGAVDPLASTRKNPVKITDEVLRLAGLKLY
ncbi:hypothetical protein MNV49_002101 [Pseudohyphozyma bogoriensis]|nr:hypothetical protein MNV49_002101 [Pseudohyphozyma bogoriensis]